MLKSAEKPHTHEPAPTQPRPAAKKPSTQDDIGDVELVTVTPEMAKKWLEPTVNLDNRKISKDGVKRYAKDMREGRWHVSGEAIKFDAEGILIDGQHRLLACIDSHTPFKTLIVTGLPNETKAVMDLGIRRNTAAILGSLGYRYKAEVSATAISLLTIKAGSAAQRNRVSTPEIIALLERHPKLLDSVEYVYGGKPRTPGPIPALTAAIHYIGSELLEQKELADKFADVFKTGVPTYENDAAHALRESILGKRSSSWVFSRGALLGLSCHSWNLFAKHIPAQRLHKKNEAIIDGLDTEKI